MRGGLRTGSGRKKKPEKEKKGQVNFTCPMNLKKKLEKIKNHSKFICEAILEKIQTNKKKG